MIQTRHIIYFLVLAGVFGCSKKQVQLPTVNTYAVHISDTANEYPVYLSGHIGSKNIAHSITKAWDSVFTAQTGTDIYLYTYGLPSNPNNNWNNLLWMKLSCSYEYYDGLYNFTKPGDTTLSLDLKLP